MSAERCRLKSRSEAQEAEPVKVSRAREPVTMSRCNAERCDKERYVSVRAPGGTRLK